MSGSVHTDPLLMRKEPENAIYYSVLRLFSQSLSVIASDDYFRECSAIHFKISVYIDKMTLDG